MNKWFTVAWIECDDDAELEQTTQELRGPFDTDNEREEAIDEAVHEDVGNATLAAIVRFDIEGEGVPEIVE